MHCSSDYYELLIKYFSSVSKIKDETGVQISIPNEQTNSDEIKVEGNKEGVKKAIEEITEIVKRIVCLTASFYILKYRFPSNV